MPFTVFSAFLVVQSSSQATHVKNRPGARTVPPPFLTVSFPGGRGPTPLPCSSAPFASMTHQSGNSRRVGRAPSVCPVTSSSDCGGWRAGTHRRQASPTSPHPVHSSNCYWSLRSAAERREGEAMQQLHWDKANYYVCGRGEAGSPLFW